MALAAVGLTGLAGACAKQGAPPGGPEDRRPPVVVATHPDTFAVLTEPFRGPVRFDFDERISERTSGGTLDQAVVVSPRTGRVRVGHGRQSISVDLEGGFRPGLVYRVTLLPVLRDLFNNQLSAPFEVVFSTGGDFNASAVAGTAWDRVSAEGVDALEVLAFEEGGDSMPHVARTDTGGVYVFRYLPPAAYRMVAYQDRNRNGVVDPMELQGSKTFQVGGPDTLIVDVSVLQPDTTPARLTKATVLDSLTVMVEFDDALDPLSAASLMGVSLTSDSTGALVPMRILHAREYTAWRGALEDSFARLDSAEAAARAMDALEEMPVGRDTLRADTAAADTVRTRPTPRPQVPQIPRSNRPLPPTLPPAASGGGRAMAPGAPPGSRAAEPLAPDGGPLPSRRLVLRLEEPLVPAAAYKLFAGSVLNINGVGGGGGEAVVVRQLPADTTSATDSAAADTSAPDTTRPDTSRARGDTIPPAGSPSGRSAWPFQAERRR
ncbi:MAG TPA: Ig-like domain-containing protein [Longimicrobiales bacterium]|nr:Ig-like domain-containing protein [Longimicrobiales bacterium]